MKRLLITIVLISLGINLLTAQRRNGLISRRIDTEGFLSLSVGPAYCAGDQFGSIFEKSFLDGNNFSTSLGFRQMFPGNFGYKANFTYGNYFGSDGLKQHSVGFLSFNSSVLEFTLRGEYAPFNFGPRFRRDTPNSIYFFLGGGIASANVTSKSINYPVDVAKTLTAVIPVGFGYQYDFNNGFLVGAEFGWQFAFSDYMDGYHPPIPNSKSNDILGNFAITVSYKLF